MEFVVNQLSFKRVKIYIYCQPPQLVLYFDSNNKLLIIEKILQEWREMQKII